MLNAGGQSVGPQAVKGLGAAPDTLLGPAPREGSRILALVGKRKDPLPHPLLVVCWPGGPYLYVPWCGWGGGMILRGLREDQRQRGDKAQMFILAWRKPIPSASLWLAEGIGGSQINRESPGQADSTQIMGFLG